MAPAVTLACVALFQSPQETAWPVVPDSSAVYSVVLEISSATMSPYCPGKTIATCPSPGAAILQDSIKSLVIAGWSPEQIESWLVADFGDEVRGRPAWRGFGIVGWTLPYLGIAAVATFLVLFLRRRGGHPSAVEVASLHPSDDERLVTEMRRLNF